MNTHVLARITHVVTVAILSMVSVRTQVFWGLTYAIGMAALWALLEMAIRGNPGMLNNPSVSAADRDLLMDLGPAVIGKAVAPVCIGGRLLPHFSVWQSRDGSQRLRIWRRSLVFSWL